MRYLLQSKTITKSRWPFEVHISRIYTRAVFKDFEKKLIDCTAYNIEDPADGREYYLVSHTNKTSKISWGQHRFIVHANKETGYFHCECNEWRHTGMSKKQPIHNDVIFQCFCYISATKFVWVLLRFVLCALTKDIHAHTNR